VRRAPIEVTGIYWLVYLFTLDLLRYWDWIILFCFGFFLHFRQ